MPDSETAGCTGAEGRPDRAVVAPRQAMKRAFDVVAAATGLVVLMPVLSAIALAVRLTSPGPALFRQARVGFGGRDFMLYKFRTMTMKAGTEAGSFDVGDSSRVTGLGRWLRATKLDELPQIWNVVRGDMSLVGPRPEVRKWVEAAPARWAVVHSVRPGLTDPASIVFRDEERLLTAADDPERTYRERVLPRKLDLYEEYVRTRSFWKDLVILGRTVVAVIAGAPDPGPTGDQDGSSMTTTPGRERRS
jgi:lipopolysaccharide/colanic/teichoic acid biosynthesis glycosyltransferase